jgi:excisionase family DNA binding protein
MSRETAKAPSSAVAMEARKALRALSQATKKKVASVRFELKGEGRDAVTVSMPQEALDLLVEVLGQMANGNAVTIVPIREELTTHEAAEFLNVSRPYLIGLLEAGKIPYRMVGTHRRVRFIDLQAFKKQDDARRDQTLAELTRQAEDLDLGY